MAKPEKDGTEMLNAEEAAKALGMHIDTVWKLCKSGELPACKVGHRWFINKAALLKKMEGGFND